MRCPHMFRKLLSPSIARDNRTRATWCVWAFLSLAPFAVGQEYDVIKKLPTLGGKLTRGFGINNGGQVVGQSDVGNFISHAFLWSLSGGIRDLGTLGGSSSVASGINDSGQVVGTADTST